MASISVFIIFALSVAVPATCGFEEKIQHHPFLLPLLKFKDANRISAYYEAEFFQTFGWDQIKGAALHNTLLNILLFPQVKLILTVGLPTEEEVTEQLYQFLKKYTPAQITSGKFGFDENFEDLLVQFVRSDFQNKNDSDDLNALLNSEFFITAFARLETNKYFNFKSDQERRETFDYVMARKRGSLKKKTPFYTSYLDFLESPQEHMEELFTSLMIHVGNPKNGVFEDSEVVMVELLLALSRCLPSERLLAIAEKVIDAHSKDKKMHPFVKQQSMHLITRVMSDYDQRADYIVATQVLALAYPNTHSAVIFQPEYKQFISRFYNSKKEEYIRYKRGEKLPPFAVENEILDLIFIAPSLSPSELPDGDFRYLLTLPHNLTFSTRTDVIRNVQKSRYLMTRGIQYINHHFELYADLYQTILSFACRVTYKPWDYNLKNMAHAFDKFVDHLQGMYWEDNHVTQFIVAAGSESVFWDSFYHEAIGQNYMFYKSLLLLEWIDAGAERWKFTFRIFYFSDNTLLHRFLLCPLVRPVLKELQRKMARNKGYNYKVFSEKEVPADFGEKMAAVSKRKAEYFKMHQIE